jgi:hypothetical protein
MIILAFTVLLLAAPACNMPHGDSAIDIATSKIEEKLAETGNLTPRTVEITRDQVTVAIDIPLGETEIGLYSTWVYLFNCALENVPNANQVVLELYTLGEPYATLIAQSDDIEAVISEQIDLLTFFSRLEMQDQRSPEDGLRQALASRDWIVTNVTITRKRVDIEAFPPVAQTYEEIVMDLFEAIYLTVVYAPDSQQVYLHLLLTEQPDLTVMANMADVHAYQVGKIDPGTFLSGLTISE